jgi:sodium-dependent dicarboxylate transporter 2/3/5
MALVLFVVPSRSGDARKRVMDWESLRDMSWGVLILLGGGFALAKGFTASGLSLWVGEELEDLDKLPIVLLIFAVAGTFFYRGIVIRN